MTALVQTGIYFAIIVIYTITILYYVIKFISRVYTLQEATTFDGEVSSSGEIVIKSQYMKYMQYNTILY